MEDLTSFQRDLLFLLSDIGPEYGLAIKEELEEYYDDEINHGQLYPNLDDLVEQGFVVKGERDRRTNEYELTDEGHEAIRKRLEWQQQRAQISA